MALASPFVEYELFGPAVDEWVAHAPYPDQALHAARHAPSTSLDATAHTPPRSPNPYREDIESVECRSHPSKIGNSRRRAVRDPPSIAGRSLAIRSSQDKRPDYPRMPLPGRPKDFHRPATRITDRWFRARDGRRLERTPQAPSARQDRTIGLAQRQGQNHRLSLAGHRVRWHARDHRAIHLGTHRLSQHTAGCSRR